MNKFKIGDKVKVVREKDGEKPPGVGEIIEFFDSVGCATVRFADWTGGHGKGGHEWNFPVKGEYLKHANELFMPGDHVVRTNIASGRYGQVGQEATVVFFDPTCNTVYVTYPGHYDEKHGGEGWFTCNVKHADKHNYKVGDCGFTEGGKSYKVVKVWDTLLDVVIDGELITSHCCLDGKCFGDGRKYPDDLLPPTFDAPTVTIADTRTFMPGDRVRVVRKARSHENDWENSWVPSMDDAVGKEFVVASCGAIGVRFESRYEAFPPFVLELLHKAETNTNTDTTNPKTEDKFMLRIEDRIYIDGSNASDYSEDLLIKKISEAEAEVTRLKAIDTKSAKIEARIAELESGAKRLAAILDARA